MSVLWRNEKPVVDGSCFELSSIQEDLERAVHQQMLEKAAFLSVYPDNHLIALSALPAGILVLFPSGSRMEEVESTCIERNGLISCSTLAQLQEEVKAFLDQGAIENAQQEYKLNRNLYLKLKDAVNETRNTYHTQQAEYHRVAGSLKSLKTSDSWLNRENTKQINRVTAAEREVRDYASASRTEEHRLQILTDSWNENAKKKQELETKRAQMDDVILTLKQDIHEIDTKLTPTMRIFQNAKWREFTSTRNEKNDALQKKKQEKLDTEPIYAKCVGTERELEQKRVECTTEIERLKQARKDAEARLIKMRTGYANGEKMFADSQDRIHQKELRLEGMKAPLEESHQAYLDAEQKLLPAAAAYVDSYCKGSVQFRGKLNAFCEWDCTSELKPELLKAVFFLYHALFASGSNLHTFFASQKEAQAAMTFQASLPNGQDEFAYTVYYT